MTATEWLVELPGSQPTWFAGGQAWTHFALDAIRFPTRAAAVQQLRALNGYRLPEQCAPMIVTEHVFIGATRCEIHDTTVPHCEHCGHHFVGRAHECAEMRAWNVFAAAERRCICGHFESQHLLSPLMCSDCARENRDGAFHRFTPAAATQEGK
jgi:hypothetical protein